MGDGKSTSKRPARLIIFIFLVFSRVDAGRARMGVSKWVGSRPGAWGGSLCPFRFYASRFTYDGRC